MPQNSTTRLRSAIIGTGHIAKQHIAALRQCPHAELVGVCDLSPATAASVAERFGVPRFFANHRELLSELRPDVVHITTPPKSHVFLATEALKSGAHVIVEKPIAPQLAEVHQLIELAESHDRLLIEDYNYVFNQPVQEVLEEIRSGEFGDIAHVDVMLCLDIAGAAGGVADAGASDCLPGGPVGDFLPHLASLVHAFVGPASDVTPLWPEPLEFRALLAGTRGTATMSFSSASAPDAFWLRLYGSHMQVTLNLFEPHKVVRKLHKGPRPLTPVWNGLSEAKAARRASLGGLARKLSGGRGAYDGLWTLIERTYAALAEGTSPPVTHEDIRAVNDMIHHCAPGAPTTKQREEALV